MDEKPGGAVDELVVVNVSLAASDRDYDTHVTLWERPFRLVRVGSDGDVGAAEQAVRDWADTADAIAITGIREARAAGPLRRRVGRDRPGAPGHRRGSGHRWSRPARRLAGVGHPRRTELHAGLFHQRPSAGARRPQPRPHHPDSARVHREPRSPTRCCASTSPANSTPTRCWAWRLTSACGRCTSCRAWSSRS